jgi:hypothetical protein
MLKLGFINLSISIPGRMTGVPGKTYTNYLLKPRVSAILRLILYVAGEIHGQETVFLALSLKEIALTHLTSV